MKCPKCGSDMKVSKAIKTGYPDNAITILPIANIRAEELELIDCMKCVACGHSKDMPQIKE